MTRRMWRKYLAAYGVVLGLAVSAWLMSAAGAVTRPAESKPDLIARATTALERAGTTAPRFRPAPLATLEEFAGVPELPSVHFDPGKAEIRASDARALDRDAEWLKSYAFYDLILVEAYADGRGSTEYNIALSEQRARAVRDRLVARGVLEDRIALAAYGEGRPACTAQAEACWAQNRRADILIRRRSQEAP